MRRLPRTASYGLATDLRDLWDEHMTKTYPDIGARMRELRKARRNTLQELSDRSGYSTGYLSRLENGSRVNPTVAFIWDMSQALGVTPAAMLGLEEPGKVEPQPSMN